MPGLTRTIERTITEALIRHLCAQGCRLTVSDGNGGPAVVLTAGPAETEARIRAAVEEAMAVDVANLYIQHARGSGFVLLVYGNEGWDLISDYSVSLEPLIAPINAFADAIEAGHVTIGIRIP